MKMNDLIRFDVPAEIICLWKEREGLQLLPAQELAVKRYGLFGSENLLIQAPTSSGKTFIGEMAAVRTALRRKKVVYLVPLKALAEEKYRDFKEKYESYGIRVIISSRDHREFDRDLEEGNFSIAIVVYEKLSQLLVRRPERLKEIELIVADELELLSDPERGSGVEVLLTRIVQSPCRLIGLSAVIGGADKLAEWMNAKLLIHERRPVELRYGVLHDGIFRYRTYNELSEAEEHLVEMGSESSWEVLTQNVRAFIERGETCLIFVKSKHEARRGAELLAMDVTAPAAEHALEDLRACEETRCRKTLLATLNSGVGFHSADLSPEEREIVERAYRSGEIHVMVSTSTLAVGLNMPARNVFITADKWQYDGRFGMPWKSPILRSEYENMGGRAGRYGAGHAYGRSLLIASTPFDQETLWRRYIEGERESIEPRLAKEPLEDHILQLVASRICRTERELLDFLEATLSGQWIWHTLYTLDEVEFRIRAAVNRAADAGMLAHEPGGAIEATPLGNAVAAKGIRIASARELERWITESEHRTWSELDLILAAAMTPDGRTYSVALTAKEYDHADYPGILRRVARDDESTANVQLNKIRNSNLTPFFEEVRAIKVALFLAKWIEHEPVYELEKQFATMTGQILAAADQIAWLIDAAGGIAGALGCTPRFVERMRKVSLRVERGLREEALPLAHVKAPRLSRGSIVGLVAHDLHTPVAIASATDRAVSPWVSSEEFGALKNWAQRVLESNAVKPAPEPRKLPLLVIDDRYPGTLTLDGVLVDLQDKQYRLIQTLAAAPGECVPYEDIYKAVWGDSVVENNQIHFQKRKLLDRIEAVAPRYAALVKTVPKRGFMLALQEEQVRVKRRRETVPA